MMKYLTTLGLIIVLSFTTVQAQVTTTQGTELGQRLTNLGSSSALIPQAEKYIGSPYFLNWSKGYLVLSNNKKTATMKLRYNMANNSVQYINNGALYAIPGKKIRKYVISTTNGQIVFQTGFSSKKYEISTNRLLHVIYNGKVKLLVLHSAELFKNVPTYGSATTVNEYETETSYYLVTVDGMYHEVDLEKDDILDTLPGNNEKLKAFANKSHLSFSKPTQVSRLMNYYNLILNSNQ